MKNKNQLQNNPMIKILKKHCITVSLDYNIVGAGLSNIKKRTIKLNPNHVNDKDRELIIILLHEVAHIVLFKIPAYRFIDKITNEAFACSFPYLCSGHNIKESIKGGKSFLRFLRASSCVHKKWAMFEKKRVNWKVVKIALEWAREQKIFKKINKDIRRYYF